MKSEGFSHYILTKFNTQPFNGALLYDNAKDANKWMTDRMPLWEQTKQSVLSQAGEFRWVISIDDRTPDRFINQIFTDDRMIRVGCDIRDVFKKIEVDTEWIITTRMDNDDVYLPGSVLAIQSAFVKRPIIIDLRYQRYYADSDTRVDSGRRGPNSPFLSLVERTDMDIRTAFARPHNLMNETFQEATFADRRILALQVIHGNNAMNK